jgi:hypothetical protein
MKGIQHESKQALARGETPAAIHLPIAGTSGTTEYTAGQQELPVILTRLADMV